jgi:tight adherence protein C
MELAMTLISGLLFGITIILIGLVALLISLRWLVSDEISTRLQTYVTDDIRQVRQSFTRQVIQQPEVSGSLIARTVLPWFRSLGYFLGRLTPGGVEDTVRKQLVAAGNPLNLGPREFIGLRVALLLLGGVLMWVVMRQDLNRTTVAIGVIVAILSYLFPIFWLRAMVRSRQEKIRRGLPDALDMLSVCADAGLGFDQSLLRVSEYWRTPIGLEFGRVVAEMEMGVSRREALRNMSERLDVSELTSFVSVILQSEQLGMSIADTLHAQADQMRVERRFRAQELARTIPIKMLIPLAFLIFPAILAVLLGPAIPQIFELFKSF